MDCSLPGSSVYGIPQAKILEWVSISFSRGSSQPKDQTRVFCISCIAGEFFNHWTVGEARYNTYHDTIAIGSFFQDEWRMTTDSMVSPQIFFFFRVSQECFCFHWILYCKYIIGIQQRNHENIHKTYKIFICGSFHAPDNFSFYWGDVLKNNIAPLQGSRSLLWFSSFHTICIISFMGSLPRYLCTCVFLWSAEVLSPHSTAVSEFMEYLSRKQLFMSSGLSCNRTRAGD